MQYRKIYFYDSKSYWQKLNDDSTGFLRMEEGLKNERKNMKAKILIIWFHKIQLKFFYMCICMYTYRKETDGSLSIEITLSKWDWCGMLGHVVFHSLLQVLLC